MHSSKVSLSKALSNAALSGFNHPYSCEYSESACEKETLDLCIFFFFLNFNIFYKMLFSDGVGNDCFLSSCWDLNGGSSVHSVNYSRQRVGLHEVAIPKQIGELLFDFWLSELLPYYKVYTLKYVTVCRDVGKRKGWKLVMAWRE